MVDLEFRERAEKILSEFKLYSQNKGGYDENGNKRDSFREEFKLDSYYSDWDSRHAELVVITITDDDDSRKGSVSAIYSNDYPFVNTPEGGKKGTPPLRSLLWEYRDRGYSEYEKYLLEILNETLNQSVQRIGIGSCDFGQYKDFFKLPKKLKKSK